MSAPNEKARRANARLKLHTFNNEDNSRIQSAIEDVGTNFVSWGEFKMTPKGLSCPKKSRRGVDREEQPPGEERISSPFEIIGACRDPSGRGWGKWLRWRDKDGRLHSRHVADAALHGDRSALCGGLADEGLTINRSQHQAFVTYLSGASVKGRLTIVHRTGWHEIAGRSVFVLPAETIGPRGIEPVILDAPAVSSYEARGTLQDWQQGVGAMSSDHALVVLAISTALAGPLVHVAGTEGGGIHFFGHSSLGKTTLGLLAASVWGPPGFMRSWRSTANGLEGLAALSSDTVLILDEFGQIDAREVAAALYSLANGTGKQRAERDGSPREPKSWRVLILSSGEMTTETKLAEDKSKKARAGQLVRMLDVPAERGFGFGAFDSAGSHGDAGKLAKAFKDVASSAYGTVGPEFVRRIIAEEVSNEHVRELIAKFVASEVPPSADGQIHRAAQRLGLIAAAGELATALGVTPWQVGATRRAAAWALARWIEGRGGTGPAEERQAIAQVRLFIEQHGESRFERLDRSDARQVINRAGWCKGSGAEREWWVSPEVWRVEVCAGIDATMAARTLCGRAMLRRQSASTFQCSVKVEGIAKRAYVLTADILQGGSDAS
jgi:uncharacterized protein (DUF927 family)